jgi:oxygen-independent coproporphyrinogen-3 oxidase
LPEIEYVQALLADLATDLTEYTPRTIQSIFIGGGTPSLFSAQAYHLLFTELKKMLPLAPDIEITMEANPGSVEQQRFTDYRQLGINRLSLGIQSFNARHLKKLGRVHDEQQAHRAIEAARNAGFTNLNLDIMHGLPSQTIAEGMDDLKTALAYQPEHLSWYQLTIEPNTVFYKENPPLPSEDEAYFLEEQGLSLLKESGFTRYEISAFCQNNQKAHHNMNYWLFGDYLGIGAGAHGKLTQHGVIQRTQKHRMPKEYQNPNKPFLAQVETISAEELVFEFMLNTTRLEQAVPLNLLTQRTGLSLDFLLPKLKKAHAKNLIHLSDTDWQITPLGRRYTNDLQVLFLP